MKNYLQIFAALVFLSLSISLHAQMAPSIEWQKSFGGIYDETATSIQQTFDKGFIICGTTQSNDGDVSGNHGGDDVWIVKLDSTGNLIWQKCFGGSSGDYANSIEQTTDSGYIVAASSSSNDSDVSGNHGETDFWIVKLDLTGSLQWQRSLGGSNFDEAYSMEQTFDGGFIITGYTKSHDGDVLGWHPGYEQDSVLTSDYWIVKLDASGDLMWQKCLGGSQSEVAHSVKQTSDGGYIVFGWSKSIDGDVTGNHGNYDYWIVKLDSSGNLLWQKSFGGAFDDYASSIQQTSDGGFIIAGSSASTGGDVYGNHGMYDYWIVKLDSIGNLLWQKCLGGSATEDARLIYQTVDGGFVVTGSAASNDGDISGNHSGVLSADYWVTELDSNGDLVWQKCLGGTSVDDAFSIQQTADDGFIIAGTSRSNDGDVSGNHLDNFGLTTYDYWVVKLSPDIPLYVASPPLTSIAISPNPFTTQFQIQYTITQPGELVVYNALGRKVKLCLLPANQNTFQLSVAELPPGVYLVDVNSGGQLWSEKVVKE